MKQLGVGVDLAPVLDVDGRPGPSATNPDGSRSFSPVPAVAARYGVAFLQGLGAGGVIPVVKHFPGLGGSTGNTDVAGAQTLPLATLRSSGLVPFEAAIKAGAPAVMVANAAVPGLTSLPASLSADTINGLLRQQLGFDGLVLTDSLSAGAISQAGYSLPAAATAAVQAGADMVLFGSTLTAAQTELLTPTNVTRSINEIVTALVDAVRSGAIPDSRLNEAVGHILAARSINLCSH
jgi:beta-N-acetylhexosaminidase